MRNPLRKRWTVQVTGVLSGRSVDVSFMNAWRRKTVERRVARMNATDDGGLTHWEVVKR